MATPKYKEKTVIDKDRLVNILTEKNMSVYEMCKRIRLLKNGVNTSTLQTSVSRGRMTTEQITAVAEFLNIDPKEIVVSKDVPISKDEPVTEPDTTTDIPEGTMPVSAIALRLALSVRKSSADHLVAYITGLDSNRIYDAVKAKEWGYLRPGEIAVIARYLEVEPKLLTNGAEIPHVYTIIEKRWKEKNNND